MSFLNIYIHITSFLALGYTYIIASFHSRRRIKKAVITFKKNKIGALAR